MKKAKYLVFIGIGVELFAYTMTSVFIGRYIDDYFSTKGICTALLVLIFGAFWFYRILRVLKSLNQDSQ